MTVFCLGFPIGLWEGMRLLPGAIAEQPKVSYAELVTILLTGITVILAVLAVMVAVLAIWGYSNIRAEAASAAKAAVESAVEASVSTQINDEAIQARIKEELSKSVREHLEMSYPAAFPQGASADQGVTERIAEELPGEDNEAR
jgi:hypothetical protein